MKRFQFKLSPVLKIRKSAEDQALRVLADAQRALQAEIDRRVALMSKLDEALDRRQGLGQTPIDAQGFRLEEDFIAGTKQRIVQAAHAIVRTNRIVEKAMRAYLLARRQTRAIEILRDKAQQQFKQDLARREQREMDDLTVMRARIAKTDPFGEESA